MINFMEKIKTKKINVLLFIYMYSLYAICLNWSFTADQINAWNATEGKIQLQSPLNFITGGRFAGAFLQYMGWLLSKIGISIYQNQFILKFIIIFAITFSILTIYKCFGIREPGALFILSLMFVNPYFVEVFTYTGYEWALSLILALWAVNLFIHERYIYSGIILLCTISIYQSYVEVFLIISTAYIYVFVKEKQNVLKEYLKMIIVAGIPALMNILIVKIFILVMNYYKPIVQTQNTVAEVKEVSTTAGFFQRTYSVLIVYYESVCTSFGMFPKGTIFLIICLVMLITIAYMLYQHNTWKRILYYICVNIMIQFFSVAIYFVAVGTGATAGRVVWTVFLSLSMTILVSLYHLRDLRWKNAVIVIAGIFTIFDIYVTETAAMDFFISNKLDMQEAIQIQAEIQQYENKSGMCIDTIAVRYADGHELRDCSPLLCRKYIMGTYHNTTFHKSWSNVELVNYINKEHYKKDEMPEAIYQKYFAGQKWITFMPDEQMAFEGTTAYWIIY